MSAEYLIAFDAERCVACHGCTVSCKVWRERPVGVYCRRIEKIWQQGGEMPRLRHASINCQHCAEPACMEACPENAISKNADGIVLVDEAKCVGCRTCETACPFGVPQFPDDGEGKMVKCDLCVGRYDMEKEEPPCVATCPTHALKLLKASPEEKRRSEAALLDLLNSGE